MNNLGKWMVDHYTDDMSEISRTSRHGDPLKFVGGHVLASYKDRIDAIAKKTRQSAKVVLEWCLEAALPQLEKEYGITPMNWRQLEKSIQEQKLFPNPTARVPIARMPKRRHPPAK
jgi:hypothetical protein